MIPEEILLPLEIEDAAALAEVLGELQRGARFPSRVRCAEPSGSWSNWPVKMPQPPCGSAMRSRPQPQLLLGELQQRLQLVAPAAPDRVL